MMLVFLIILVLIGVIMQNKNILGVNLSLHTLREALNYSDYLMQNGALNTVHYISTRTLMQASKQAELKQLLESTDILICAETDILRAAGINSSARMYEIENHLYLKELCRKIYHNNGQFCLLSDTEEGLQTMKEIISGYLNESFTAVCQTLSKLRGSNDILVPEVLANELNDIAPTIILSNLPFSYQLQLMHELKPFLNAKMWIGLPSDMKLLIPPRHFSFSAFQKIWKKYFKKKVHQYQNESEASDENNARVVTK